MSDSEQSTVRRTGPRSLSSGGARRSWRRAVPRALGAALAALVLWAVLPSGPAAAAPSPPERPTHRSATGAALADRLRHSTVYVDPAYASAVPAKRRHRLAAHIRATGVPIKIVLVPLAKGDAFDGDSDVLADVLHDHLGNGPLVLITLSGTTDDLDGYEWPDDDHQAVRAVEAVSFMPSMQDAGLADRLDKAVELVGRGDGETVYDRLTADLGGPSSPGPSHGDHSSGGGAWILPTVVAAVLLAGAGAVLLLRRRSPAVRPRRPAPRRGGRLGAVFAAARKADESALRRRAQTEVLALGAAVSDADPGAVPLLDQALEAYTAAGTVLDGARGPADLAGVLALTAAGRDLLDGRADALPLCFFDPRHGRASRRTRWRPMGRREHLDAAVCRDCERQLRRHRTPEALDDTGPGGALVPYFRLPPERSVWAATGYGSLVPVSGPDGLAARINRGDFTRTVR